MTATTVRADARTLPEATNRRALLRSIVAAAAGITASAPVALACLPAAAATAKAPAELGENQDLLDLGLRVSELSSERDQTLADLQTARSRFVEIAPLPPRPRKKPERLGGFFKIVRNPGPRIKDQPFELSVDRAYELYVAAKSLAESKITREFLGVSDRYMGKLFNAAYESNYMGASGRLRDLEKEIQEHAQKLFEFEPKTSLGVSAQAAALLAINLEDWREHKEFCRKLAVSVIRVVPLREEAVA